MSVQDRFYEVFNDPNVREIEFNPAWKNGTDYLDLAVKGKDAPVLENGEVVKCDDDYGRQVILIGHKAGNIVIFQRRANEYERFVANLPDYARRYVNSSFLTEDNMYLLLGDSDYKQNLVKELMDTAKDLAV
jgi:hypothetical protein